MRLLSLFILVPACLSLAVAAGAAQARIIKVLPHYLDAKGRHSLGASLFERDAYQEVLRQHPEKRSAVRFDVQWKANHLTRTNLSLILEVRGSNNRAPNPIVLETRVRPRGLFRTWTAVTISGAFFEHLGEPTGWRASLWDGDTFLAEQKSFLW